VLGAVRNNGPADDTVRIHTKDSLMNSIVYIVGAIVIIVALLSFLGLR
jgi:hypothetical protein